MDLRPLLEEEYVAWRELARRYNAPPFAWPCVFRAFKAAYSKQAEAYGLFRFGKLSAIVTLEDTVSIGPWREARAPQNEHCPYVAVAWDRQPETAKALVRALRERYSTVSFDRVHLDNELWGHFQVGSRSVLLPNRHTCDTATTIVRPLEQFRLERSRRVHESTRRKLKKMERAGTVDFSRSTDFDPDLLEACFHIETLGWKAQEGTPILHDPQATVFYRTLAEEAASEGIFCLSTLRLDGKLVAYEYTLRAGRRADVLKVSYHPDHAALSPGSVLMLLAIEQEVRDDLVDSCHVGGPTTPKLAWTDRQDVVGSAGYYFGAKGWLRYWTDPVPRQILRRHPVLHEKAALLKERLKGRRSR